MSPYRRPAEVRRQRPGRDRYDTANRMMAIGTFPLYVVRSPELRPLELLEAYRCAVRTMYRRCRAGVRVTRPDRSERIER